MLRIMDRWISGICFGLVTLIFAPAAYPQQDPEKTLLEIEIVIPSGRGEMTMGHRWAKVFSDAGESARVRGRINNEVPLVREHKRGTFNSIRMVGMLDQHGQIQFPNRTFSLDQTEQLEQWLSEIRLYGPQGSPDGLPMWGLNKQQFETFLDACSQPIEGTTAGLTLPEVLLKNPLVDVHVLEVHSLAKSRWEESQDLAIYSELQNLSSGTALAYTLSQVGLVFRPVRRADESVDLVVELIEDVEDPWPIGWPMREGQNRAEVFPDFFRFGLMSFEGTSVNASVKYLESQTKVHILTDMRTAGENRLDLNAKKVNFPQRNTSYSIALRSILLSANMRSDFMLDDAGLGFIWAYPIPRSGQAKPKADREVIQPRSNQVLTPPTPNPP